MSTIKSIGKERLVVEGKGGAFVENCFRDATILALNENQTVTLLFNEKTYTIKPQAIYSLVGKTLEDEGEPSVNLCIECKQCPNFEKK